MMNKIKIFGEDDSKYILLPIEFDMVVYLPKDYNVDKLTLEEVGNMVDRIGRIDMGEMVLNNLDISRIIRE